MKRDLPTMAMTMNRVVADAENFYRIERERVRREMNERLHPPAKPTRQERRARKKESFETRLRERFKSQPQQ